MRVLVVPIWSPTQPFENTLGAVALYLVAFAVLTSYFRHVFGFHRWKQLHYTTDAAAASFFVHGLLTDPELKNRPVDWLDAEKVFVEVCLLLVAAATLWRVEHGRRRRALRYAASTTGVGSRKLIPIPTVTTRPSDHACPAAQ